MTKKLLSLILSVAFILGCFSTASVSASSITITDDDYSKAGEALAALCPGFPLIDDEASSDAKPTTRAEFVAAMAMVMGVDVKSGVETPFSDVSAKHQYASAIKYAAQAGLISTVDLFFPESPITYSQALKIAMVAAGYGDKAEYTGGYPIGYIKAAKEAGVAEGINLADTDTLTHAQATQIIFEAAICDMLEISAWGDSFDYSTSEGKNILSVYKKVYMAFGVVEANENTALTNASNDCGEDTITIDGVKFYAPGYENLIGKSARVFYGNDKKNTVIFAYENGNEIVNYTNEDDLSISGLNLTVMPAEGEKDLRYGLESDYSVIYNGKFYGSANYNSVINPTAGSVSLIDNNDNKKIDVIVIKDVEYGIIGSVNEFEEKVYDKYKKGGMLDLSDSSVKYMVSEDNGAAIELHDLESGFVVGYAVSKDGKLVEIIHYTQRVGGTFDSRTSDGKLELKGKEYQLSSYYTTNVKTLDNIKFGSEIILHLGVGNQVIFIEEFTSGMNYGVFVAAAQTGGLSGKNLVLICGTDGKMQEYAVSEKFKLDGAPVSSSDINAELEGIEGRETVLRVIKYSVNANGEINKIYTATEDGAGLANLLTPVMDESRPVLYSRNTTEETGGSTNGNVMYKSGTFYPLFHMGSATGVIQVPINEEFRTDENYYVSHTQSSLDSATDGSENQPFFGYDVHNGTAKFILWTKDGAGATEVGEGGSAVIESVTQGINENGEPVKVFKAYMGSTWTKFYSKASYNDTETDLKNTVDALQPGDIVQIALNTNKEITAASVNFSYLGYKYMPNSHYDSKGYDISSRYPNINGSSLTGKRFTNSANKNNLYSAKVVGFETGYILSMADKKAMLVRNTPIADAVAGTYDVIDTVAAPLTRGSIVFVKFNKSRQTGEVTDAVVYTESDVNVAETIYTAGANADFLVQRSRYNTVAMTVIYTTELD